MTTKAATTKAAPTKGMRPYKKLRRMSVDDVDDLAVTTDAELHAAVLEREQGVVLADAYVLSGMDLGAALTQDDVTRHDGLATELLDSQILGL